MEKSVLASISVAEAKRQSKPAPFSEPQFVSSFALHSGVYRHGGTDKLVRASRAILGAPSMANSSLQRKFHTPKLPLDLNPGFESYRPNTEDDGDLDPILQNIQRNNLDVRFTAFQFSAVVY